MKARMTRRLGASTSLGMYGSALSAPVLALICSTSAVQALTVQAAAPPSHVRCSLLVGNRILAAPTADGTRTTLGGAHDFLVEGASGRVTHVIVESGGVAGVGDTLRCFAFEGLTIDLPSDAKPTLTLAVTPSAFAATPSIGARDLDPFRAEIIATQGHGMGKPPERFAPRAPILLMSELAGLELRSAADGQELGETRDAWLDVVARACVYVSLGTAEREVPIPWSSGSIVAVPRARALQLCVALDDIRLGSAPFLESGGQSLDDEVFRSKVAAHFANPTAAAPRARHAAADVLGRPARLVHPGQTNR